MLPKEKKCPLNRCNSISEEALVPKAVAEALEVRASR